MTAEQINLSVFFPSPSGEAIKQVAANLVGVIYYNDSQTVEVGLKSADGQVHAFLKGNVENMEQLAHEIISVIRSGENLESGAKGLSASKVE